MPFRSIFTPADITAIGAIQGATEQQPAQNMVGYYVINRTGATIHVQDDTGKDVDICLPFFAISGNFDVPTKNVLFVVKASDPVITSPNYPLSGWDASVNLTIDPMPVSQVALASTLAGATNVNVGTITGTVNVNVTGGSVNVGTVTGPVNIQTSAGVTVGTALPTTSQTMNYVAPITNTLIGNVSLQSGKVNAICFFTLSSTATLTEVLGHTTGIQYLVPLVIKLTQSTPFLFALPAIHPNDTSLDIYVSDTAAGAQTFVVSSLLTPIMTQPQNYGAPPLLIAPADGPSLLRVPGSAVANSTLLSTETIATFLGAAIAIPKTLYAAFFSCSYQMTKTANQGFSDHVLFGLRGESTGHILFCGAGASNAPSDASTIAFLSAFCNFTPPFPLAGASVWPSDTNFRPVIWTTNSLGTPTGSCAILSS